MEINYFTILYWFCHTSTWIRHWCTCISHPEHPPLPPPPCTIPLGRPSAPAPSIQYHTLNLDWWLISYMIFYVSMPFCQNTSAAQQEKQRTKTFYINTFPPGPTHRLQGRTALPGHTHNCVRLLSLRRECWYFVIQPHLQMLWIGCGLEESEQTPPFVSYKSGGVLGFLRTWVWLLKVI